jgi:hypothetical protein
LVQVPEMVFQAESMRPEAADAVEAWSLDPDTSPPVIRRVVERY